MMLMETRRGRHPGDEDQHFQILQIKTKKCPLGFIDKRSRWPGEESFQWQNFNSKILAWWMNESGKIGSAGWLHSRLLVMNKKSKKPWGEEDFFLWRWYMLKHTYRWGLKAIWRKKTMKRKILLKEWEL